MTIFLFLGLVLLVLAVWSMTNILALRRHFRTTPEARHLGKIDIPTIRLLSNGPFWVIQAPLGALAGLLTFMPPPPIPATVLSLPSWAARVLASGLASFGYLLMLSKIVITVVQFKEAARLHGRTLPRAMRSAAQQYWNTLSGGYSPSMAVAIIVVSIILLALLRGTVSAAVLGGLACYPIFVVTGVLVNYIRPVSVLLLAGSSHEALLLASRVRLATRARVATLLDSSRTEATEVADWHRTDSFRTPDNVKWRTVVAALERTALLIVVDLRTPSPALLSETEALLASGQKDLDRVIFVVDRPNKPLPVKDLLNVATIDGNLAMGFTTTQNLPVASALFLRELHLNPSCGYDRYVAVVSAEQSLE